MNKGKIEITRVNQRAIKAREIGIYINDTKIGLIKNGETKEFEINTGVNEIYAKIDWCKTKPMKLSTIENEITKLELGSNINGWKLLLSIYYITLNTSEYLFLKKI